MEATAEKAPDVYQGKPIGYPWETPEGSEKVLEEEPFEDQTQVSDGKIKEQITEALAEAETKVGEEAREQPEQQPQELKINIESGDIGTKRAPIERAPETETRDFEQRPPQADNSGGVSMPSNQSPGSMDIPIQTEQADETKKVAEAIVEKPETSSAEKEKEKEIIDHAIKDACHEIVEGWQTDNKIDLISSAIKEISLKLHEEINGARKENGEEAIVVDIYSPIFSAIRTVAHQLGLMRLADKMGEEIIFDNTNEAKNSVAVESLDQFTKVGVDYREKLEKYLISLSEPLDYNRDIDIMIPV